MRSPQVVRTLGTSAPVRQRHSGLLHLRLPGTFTAPSLLAVAAPGVLVIGDNPLATTGGIGPNNAQSATRLQVMSLTGAVLAVWHAPPSLAVFQVVACDASNEVVVIVGRVEDSVRQWWTLSWTMTPTVSVPTFALAGVDECVSGVSWR